jgi:putative hydrolase of HD superfamily
MYRMSLITLFAPPSLASKLDIPRCTKMALFHDMAEALVGDITPVDGVSKPEKSRREETTMDYFTKGLLGRVQGGITGDEIRAVWREYEDGETLESKYVHDIDKIELLLQMVEYERINRTNLDLGEFSWVSTRVQLPEMQEWAREIMREREELWEGKKHETFDAGILPDATKLAQGLEYYGGKQ